eukprot:2163190-Amphidinium_carterae.1
MFLIVWGYLGGFRGKTGTKKLGLETNRAPKLLSIDASAVNGCRCFSLRDPYRMSRPQRGTLEQTLAHQ